MSQYPLTACLAGLIDCLQTAPELQGIVSRIYKYYAPLAATPERGRCVLHVFPEGSSNDIELVDARMSQTIETDVVIIADTLVNKDAALYDPDTSMTLLDYEWAILQALRSKEYLGTGAQPNNACLVWRVTSIERDAPVLNQAGEVDAATPIRRIQITVRIKHRIW
jgi:hypothetical protein